VRTNIKVENLSKQYRLGNIGTGTLSHDINRWWHIVRGKEDPYLKIGAANDRTKKNNSEYVWALRDVSFDVKQGEVLGIIGRNGAGKSTLLKILSRTTLPSTGSVKVKGRIASLLEVGTGFHPELTGRENIFLNGAILGMTKREITKKFDEIVDFAGVEKYIDTPVKRYSSGMYVRLAFAVAAHLEPDILIVDEVLAVGDAEFQKKCLGKMKDVSINEGRTVLFVSHNMAVVKSLCNRGIVLRDGELVFIGSETESVSHYQSLDDISAAYKHEGSIETAIGNDSIRILAFSVNSSFNEIISVSSGFWFELIFFNVNEYINLDVTFELRNLDEIVVFHDGKIITENNDSTKGVYSVKGVIPPFLLNAGKYKFSLIFGENQRYSLFSITDFNQFEIVNESIGSNSNILPGILRYNINYEIAFRKV
jgi:lipopolysaccharide transport system ATP-binding protein